MSECQRCGHFLNGRRRKWCADCVAQIDRDRAKSWAERTATGYKKPIPPRRAVVCGGGCGQAMERHPGVDPGTVSMCRPCRRAAAADREELRAGLRASQRAFRGQVDLARWGVALLKQYLLSVRMAWHFAGPAVAFGAVQACDCGNPFEVATGDHAHCSPCRAIA